MVADADDGTGRRDVMDDEFLAQETDKLRCLHRETMRAKEAAMSGTPYRKGRTCSAVDAVDAGPLALDAPTMQSPARREEGRGATSAPHQQGHPTPRSARVDALFGRGSDAPKEKAPSDLGEMGSLHLRVHSLVNLDTGPHRVREPNLQRSLFSAELVTADYSRKKSIFTNGDITKPAAWGGGLFFRIFQADREAQFELKASTVDKSRADTGEGENSSDFGLCRLAIVPGLDPCPKPQWQPMRDRMGNLNNFRILVSWRYVSKLNNIRPNAVGSAINEYGQRLCVKSHPNSLCGVQSPSEKRDTIKKKTLSGTKMIYDGFIQEHESQVKAISGEELLDKICQSMEMGQPDQIKSLLLQKRIFKRYCQAVLFEKWDRWITENPARAWWEEPGEIRPGTAKQIPLSQITDSRTSHSQSPDPEDTRHAELENQACKQLQRVFRGHLGRIAFFFKNLSLRENKTLKEERDTLEEQQKALDINLKRLEGQARDVKILLESRLASISSSERGLEELKRELDTLVGPRIKTQEELQWAIDHENAMKIQARETQGARQRSGDVYVAFSRSGNEAQDPDSPDSPSDDVQHAIHIVKSFEEARRLKEEQLGLPEGACEAGLEQQPNADEHAWDAAQEAKKIRDLNEDGDDDGSKTDLRLLQELRLSSSREMESLVAFSEALKYRQRCELMLEERTFAQGEKDLMDKVAELEGRLLEEKSGQHTLETQLKELLAEVAQLQSSEKHIHKEVAEIKTREGQMLHAAKRGLKLYENLLRGVPLQAEIDGDDKDAMNDDWMSVDDEGTKEELMEMQERCRQVLEEDLAEAYNSSQPTQQMRGFLEEFDAQIQHCGMNLRAPKNMEPTGFNAAALADAKRATFRFLMDQIQHGSGILRALDSTNLQPMDVIKIMDLCTLQGCDAGDCIFEQNRDGDEWGIVMTGHVKVLYNRRDVSNLVKGQAFCDLGLMTPGINQIRGASFRSEVRSYVILIPYQKFADHIKVMGSRFENAVKDYLRQSISIGREHWSQYGNAAKRIEICFLEFMSRQSGLLGLFSMVEIRHLASIATYRKLKQNEPLCTQGDVADSLFIVLSGLACVVINGKSVAYITRGQEVGELGLIANFANTRTATIVAHYDFEVAVISYQDFFAFFAMVGSKRSHQVANFIASCALPKYFALAEWKREAILRAGTDLEKSFAALNESEFGRSVMETSAVTSDGTGTSKAIGKKKSDTFLRQSGSVGHATHGRQMMVQALLEQADNADKQKVSQKFAKQFNLASKALSALGANETVDDQVQAQIGTQDFERRMAGKFAGVMRSRISFGRSQETQDAEASVKTMEGVPSAEAENNCSEDVITKREKNCRSAPLLNSKFAQKLAAFRHKTRQRNFVGFGGKRKKDQDASQSFSSSADTRALQYSPFAAPVGATPWLTPRLTPRVETPRNSVETPSEFRQAGLPQFARMPGTLPQPTTTEKGTHGMVALKRVLTATFTSVAEAFVAFDRLGTNTIAFDELRVSLLGLGLTADTIEDALRGLTRECDAWLSWSDFFQKFTWHPLGSAEEQAELLADAQRHRFSIMKSLARSVAYVPGIQHEEIISFSMEQSVVSAVRKHLAAIRQLFAADNAGEGTGIATAEFIYNRALDRQQIANGLRKIEDLGLNEEEIDKAFDVLDTSKTGLITYSEVEEVLKTSHDLHSRMRVATPRSSSVRMALPCPPSGSVRGNGVTLRRPYRPHSAKTERPTVMQRGQGDRPLTAKSRIYPQRFNAQNGDSAAGIAGTKTISSSHSRGDFGSTTADRLAAVKQPMSADRPLSGRSAAGVASAASTLRPMSARSSASAEPILEPEPAMPRGKQMGTAVSLYHQGQKLLLQGRYEDAKKVLLKGLEVDPSNTAIMVCQAKTLIDGFGEVDEAEELYERALKLKSRDVQTLRLMGNFKRHVRHDLIEADRYLQQALSIDPFCLDSLRDYAGLKTIRGDDLGALELYGRILQEDPTNPLAASEQQRLRDKTARKERRDKVAHAALDGVRGGVSTLIHTLSGGDRTQEVGSSPQNLNVGAPSNECVSDGVMGGVDGRDTALMSEGVSMSQAPGGARDEGAEVVSADLQGPVADISALTAQELVQLGFAEITKEWGDIKTMETALTPNGSLAWLDKCMVSQEVKEKMKDILLT